MIIGICRGPTIPDFKNRKGVVVVASSQPLLAAEKGKSTNYADQTIEVVTLPFSVVEVKLLLIRWY